MWGIINPQKVEVGIGLDETYMLMCEKGWREAMVGTISERYPYMMARESVNTQYIWVRHQNMARSDF